VHVWYNPVLNYQVKITLGNQIMALDQQLKETQGQCESLQSEKVNIKSVLSGSTDKHFNKLLNRSHCKDHLSRKILLSMN